MAELIWSDSYIQQLIDDGETHIAAEVTPIFHRFSIGVTAATATYTLPSFLQKILFVTWKGNKLEPLYKVELEHSNAKYRTEQGIPRWYSWSSDGLMIIRFYPVPNETIAVDDTNIYGSDIENRVIVSCNRSPDLTQSSFQIPNYIARRTIKSYVCSKAFMVEGDGQNLTASEYHKRRFQLLMQKYKGIKNKYYSSKNLAFGNVSRLITPRARLADDFTIETS